MKAKLYDDNRVVKIVDCGDVDNICNPCDHSSYVEVHMRDHSTILCDDFVFMLEGEEDDMMETNVITLTPKWEYRKETNLTMEALTEIGQDGWELTGYSTIGTLECYIFKRPVYDIPERPEV